LGSRFLKDPLPANKHWRKIAPHVFATSLFNADQCGRILAAIEDQGASLNGNYGQPNSMQDYGIVLEDENLSKWAGELVHKELKRTVTDLFSCLPHHEFSDHHAFLTVYGNEGNKDLSLHVDASHLTLNICLYNDAHGAELVFTGSRCQSHVDDAADRPSTLFKFDRGDALLHLGSQRHFVTEIDSGCRKNLVIWCRLDKERVDQTNGWIKAECPACARFT
jgi:hypothetical protein